jgi:hypothetical protein
MEINNILDSLVIFQQYNPNIYIGGSVSLILQNIIPFRVPKDIDIISPERIHVYDIFRIEGRKKLNIIRRYSYDNSIYELFFNPKADYVEYKWKDNIIKLSPADEVFEWKFRDKNKNKEKHKKDIEYYLNGV